MTQCNRSKARGYAKSLFGLRPSPVAKESKYIDMDSMSPPSDPPALEISKASAPHSPDIAFGKPQNLEHSQGALLPGTIALKNPQWTPPGQIHRYSSGPRSPQVLQPQVLQPQESASRALEDDSLTEERLEQIMASQLQQQQQEQELLHQQQMERIRLEQEALLAKLKHKLKSNSREE
ncbi:hypothetical protein BGZ49_007499 [Haplosporangium sp. Z 27]|nr:hypothetical protein BGZ49_007499 [Haplosporangium sp. Z 27]